MKITKRILLDYRYSIIATFCFLAVLLLTTFRLGQKTIRSVPVAGVPASDMYQCLDMYIRASKELGECRESKQ